MTDDDLKSRLDEIESVLGDGEELSVEILWSHEEPEGEPDFLIQKSLVMYRDEAERYGYEILGPAETGTKDDAVRVRMKEGDLRRDRGGTDSD